MKIRFLLLLSALLVSTNVLAITACKEHNYCPPQGIRHITYSPKIEQEYKKLCANAVFKIRFELTNKSPSNVRVIEGPKELSTQLITSFYKWKFSNFRHVPEAIEVVELNADCSVKNNDSWHKNK
ncbi:hypothetical protein MHM98_13450 [Psychrobium sp. MM17-31]|uniref:hypothetical protein n=1 Tax=Psychrobium sp. MM17-31 TaxID=2917758 RepID=UPI001EF4F5F8|nr:hypothetical protein [Psychrobium sp. MM17-31]MCG7532337.1 hypothetical protein [Psychrobium sp. MM17-31]